MGNFLASRAYKKYRLSVSRLESDPTQENFDRYWENMEFAIDSAINDYANSGLNHKGDFIWLKKLNLKE